jgi:uncharacterized protein (UPF0332 family)
MSVEELFKERLLRKIKLDKYKVKKSVNVAESKFEEAKRLFENDFFNQAVVSAYTSMFHLVRAFLYKDGIQEKSHYAVFIYIKEKYSDKIPKSLITSFDNYRIERHEALYGFEYKASKEDSDSVIEDADKFLVKIKEILKYGFI